MNQLLHKLFTKVAEIFKSLELKTATIIHDNQGELLKFEDIVKDYILSEENKVLDEIKNASPEQLLELNKQIGGKIAEMYGVIFHVNKEEEIEPYTLKILQAVQEYLKNEK